MLELKKIYSDGMILQRETENLIQGKADAGAYVSIFISDKDEMLFSGGTAADDNGFWCISLPRFGGGYRKYVLTAECGNEKVTVNDILFGEVFHISGQSNMELPLNRTRDPFVKAKIGGDSPYIREFRAEIKSCFDPDADSYDFAGGKWTSAADDKNLEMSAAGYYFAEDIHDRLDMPVGLVNTSAGGAALEGFMPYDMIRGYEIHNDFLDEAAKEGYIENTSAEDVKREKEWTDALGNEDFGLVPSDDMKTCNVPCSIHEIDGMGEFSGRIWFFKKFNIPDNICLDDAELILGTITDSDTAYINGVKVGETGYMYPPRYYSIPDGVLKRGENILAVRMEIKGGWGGFTKGKRYCIRLGRRTVELSGQWKYAVAARAEKLKGGVFFQGLPFALYSCMTVPVLPIKFRAMLWYQGETNCGRAYIYKKMFSDFVKYYRRECGYEIPVIFTQLCNFTNGGDTTSSWAKFRLAQLECLDVPKTAMAVTIDVGEENDLHPINKRAVGKRLAECAGYLIYGDENTFVRCVNAAYSDGKIKLTFDKGIHLATALPRYFEAVYNDRAVSCSAVQTGFSEITLDCAEKPESVRYAYLNNPANPDLLDIKLEPVSPFEIRLAD